MNFTGSITTICDGIIQLFSACRMVWAVTVGSGLVMLIIALVLKKNFERKKSPWIVGGIGLLMMLSSGAPLITSYF